MRKSSPASRASGRLRKSPRGHKPRAAGGIKIFKAAICLLHFAAGVALIATKSVVLGALGIAVLLLSLLVLTYEFCHDLHIVFEGLAETLAASRRRIERMAHSMCEIITRWQDAAQRKAERLEGLTDRVLQVFWDWWRQK